MEEGGWKRAERGRGGKGGGREEEEGRRRMGGCRRSCACACVRACVRVCVGGGGGGWGVSHFWIFFLFLLLLLFTFFLCRLLDYRLHRFNIYNLFVVTKPRHRRAAVQYWLVHMSRQQILAKDPFV